MSDYYESIGLLLHPDARERAQWVAAMRRDDPGARLALLNAVAVLSADLDHLDRRRRSLIAYAREIVKPPISTRSLAEVTGMSKSWIADKAYDRQHIEDIARALAATNQRPVSRRRNVLSIGIDWNDRPAIVNIPPGGSTVIVVTGDDPELRNLARDSIYSTASASMTRSDDDSTVDEHFIRRIEDWNDARTAIRARQESAGNHLIIVTALPTVVPPNADTWRALRYRLWVGSHTQQQTLAARWLDTPVPTMRTFTLWGTGTGEALMRDSADGKGVPPTALTLPYGLDES